MDAKELMIGNIVSLNGTPVCIVEILEYDLKVMALTCDAVELIRSDVLSHDNFRFIQLTDEWFVRLGFIKDNLGYFNRGSLPAGITKEFGGGYIMYKGHNCIHVEIKHVHHLQNLYKTLTGFDLKLNDVNFYPTS